MLRKKSSQRRLRFEALENRHLLTGVVSSIPNVTAKVTGSSLYLQGDKLADAITITGMGNNQYCISGQNGTTVNGLSKISVSGVKNNVNVTFLDGNDSLTLTNATFPADVNVTMGNGADNVYVGENSAIYIPATDSTGFGTGPVTVGHNLNVSLGKGNDSVYESSLTVAHDNNIAAGNGNDCVYLGETGNIMLGVDGEEGSLGVCVGHDFNVTLGNGNDCVVLAQVSICEYGEPVNTAVAESVDAEPGTSIAVGHDFNITLGNGNDCVSLTEGATPTEASDTKLVSADVYDALGYTLVSVGHNFNISAGSGQDCVNFSSEIEASGAGVGGYTTTVGADFNVTLGGGKRDSVTMFDVGVGHNFSVTEGNGMCDQVSLSYVIVGANLAVTTGNGGDTVTLDDIDAVQANIDTGSGADTVNITDAYFAKLYASLGAGNDSLGVADTTTTGLTYFDGGPGTDTYTNNGGNSLAHLTVVNFEIRP